MGFPRTHTDLHLLGSSPQSDIIVALCSYLANSSGMKVPSDLDPQERGCWRAQDSARGVLFLLSILEPT